MAPSLAVLASLALGASVSASRLGVVVVGTGSGEPELLAACPRAIEVVQTGTTTSTGPLLAAYAQGCTGGQAILAMPSMVGPLTTSLTAAGGDADATVYWGFAASLAFSGVNAADVRWVAAAPNLFEVANPNLTGFAEYTSAFAARLAQLVRQEAQARNASFSLLLGPWSSTAPGAFCGVLQAALGADAGVGWTWRATSASLSSTLADELQTTFGYRAVRDTCAVAGHPIFVELNAAGGWLASGARAPSQVIDFLRFVDQTAGADADVAVRGAILLRSVGSPALDDLSAIAPELVTYLANPTGGGGGGGGGGPSGGTDTGTGSGTPVVPLGSGGGRSGCGLPAGGASLAALALLAAAALRGRAGALRRRR